MQRNSYNKYLNTQSMREKAMLMQPIIDKINAGNNVVSKELAYLTGYNVTVFNTTLHSLQLNQDFEKVLGHIRVFTPSDVQYILQQFIGNVKPRTKDVYVKANAKKNTPQAKRDMWASVYNSIRLDGRYAS